MPTFPIVINGVFNAGARLTCGKNVIIDVAEEVIVGNDCHIGDNTYISGRRVKIGDHFYGYNWDNGLEIGRGRKDEPAAVLEVGDRCTFHDNRIDLSRPVTIGNDVGLSPEVTIYTHSYWMNPFRGFPLRYSPVSIGNGTIIGYRSTLVPGAHVGSGIVVGAGSIVCGRLTESGVYGGNPAKLISTIREPSPGEQERIFYDLIHNYRESILYRCISLQLVHKFPKVWVNHTEFDLKEQTLHGNEDEVTDDFRWFLFKHGVRIYTDRPFKSLPCR